MAKKKDDYEDISSYSKRSHIKYKAENARQRAKNKIDKSSNKSFKIILGILISLIIVVSALGGAYIRKVLSLINHDAGNNGNPDATFVDDTEEDLNFSTIYDVESADSIKDLIKSWALNGGEKMYSKHVINVLLIGEDNEDGSHRSDSCILASVNTVAKKITLVSFLRDTYTYMDINGTERYDKTNHTYSWGGAAKLMEVLSNNYKVKIDYYVSINFESFRKVIDILGGVTVPITEKEAAFMNRTTRCKGFEAGEAVTLNGERALIFSRIRKLDSEIERTRRQRCVINSVISNFKASSLSDLNKAIETFLPYVTTNMKTSDILSYGTQALRENWLGYKIEGMVEPSEDIMVGVSGFRTYSGYLDVWIADYVKAAREVQLALYNNTNIEINPETHISAIDLLSSSQKAEADYYGGNDYENDDKESTKKRYISELIDNWERPTFYSRNSGQEEE
ncbi:MAG: LCP family protein [Clostridia bacterium]|nr:LCP family protein [Clostridia bacterium]